MLRNNNVNAEFILNDKTTLVRAVCSNNNNALLTWDKAIQKLEDFVSSYNICLTEQHRGLVRLNNNTSECVFRTHTVMPAAWGIQQALVTTPFHIIS